MQCELSHDTSKSRSATASMMSMVINSGGEAAVGCSRSRAALPILAAMEDDLEAERCAGVVGDESSSVW